MDLLQYDTTSSSEDEQEHPKQTIARNNKPRVTSMKRPPLLNAAPLPSLLASRALAIVPQGPAARSTNSSHKQQQLILSNNPLKSQLMQPTQGPAAEDPYTAKALSRGVAGQRAAVHVDDVTFETERINMTRHGVARAPDAEGMEITPTAEYSAADVALKSAGRKRKLEAESMSQKPKLMESLDPTEDETNYGIWGPPSKAELEWEDDLITDAQAGNLTAEQLAEREYLAEQARRKGEAQDKQAEQFDKLVERKLAHLLPPRLKEDDEAIAPTTKFHGKEEFDYKGRSWIAPPSGVKPDYDDGSHDCYIPKKCTHRFLGHNKGVHRVRFFPGTGHLLLSAGLDSKCKVWSMYGNRQCMRTYIGHSAAVRDVQFSNDGSKFLSASFDRYIRLWDTESGKVLNTFTNRRVPYVVQFYPRDNNLFVVGMSDAKIVTFDATTGEITQEYNHHLAAVNTITFCEDATKMVTSSDDKKVLVWEWDIGVPIKYISDPTMHSMPAVVKHPNDRFWAGQSLDNTICVYQASGRYSLQRKKKFSGHNIAGYACDIAFSPNGKFVVSGDGDGKLFFWDWNSGKNYRKFHAHDKGPTIGCAWHPIESSLVVTCGWDAVIKVWE